MRTALTQHVIKKKVPSTSKEIIYWDSKGTGLGVRVYAPVGDNGERQRSWVVGYRFAGKQDRITLGLTSRFRLDWAAQQAREIHLQIAEGIDPKEYRRSKKERVKEESQLTVKALAEMYLKLHFGAVLNPKPDEEDTATKAAKEARRVWNQFALPKLGERKLVVDVTTAQIDEMIAEAPAVSTGRRIQLYTKATFNHARKWGFIPDSKPNWVNPADRAKKTKVNQREIIINRGEYVRAIAVTEQILEEVKTHKKFALTLQRQCLIVLLIAETGRRNCEIYGLEWKNIDFAGQNATLPRTKAGKLQTFALSDRAIVLLKKAKKLAGNNQYVFPSNTGKTALTEVKTVWNWVRERANIRKEVVLYTCRHFVITESAEADVPVDQMSQQAGHTKVSTTIDHYMKRKDKKKVETAQKMSKHLASLREVAEAA